MAKIFQIKDPAPSMGDAEAKFLVDNFDIEYGDVEDDRDPNSGIAYVRVTREKLSKFKSEQGAIGQMEKHMVSCLELMLGRSQTSWVDLLVCW